MKVVLLAAGRSFRMQPVVDKNFVKFLGKPLIEHQLDALRTAGFLEICVVGGKHNIAALRRLPKVVVREQKNLDLGMAGGVLAAASWVKNDPFILVSGNDVVEPAVFHVIASEAKQSPQKGLILAKKVSSYFPGGYLKIDSHGVITKIVEKPAPGREPSKLVNLVVHFHRDSKALFDVIARSVATKQSHKSDDVYERALQSLFDAGKIYRAVPYAGFWQPVKYPWHVLDLSRRFLSAVDSRLRGNDIKIVKSAKIYGKVIFGEGVRVMDNAVISGPAYIGKNSVIANGALVRESEIGENCVIGFGSEIARSHLGDYVWTHSNYIGDSVIGSDVAFGAGSVTGNFRLDEKEISAHIRNEKISSGRNKLGLITGDHIRVGINTSFMPGVKIGSNSCIGAGIIVAEDVPENSFVTGDWKLKIKPNREKIKPRII